MNFFRSEEHLIEWREAHPDAPGAAAVLSEAAALGAKIFGEVLRDFLPAGSTVASGLAGGRGSTRPSGPAGARGDAARKTDE